MAYIRPNRIVTDKRNSRRVIVWRQTRRERTVRPNDRSQLIISSTESPLVLSFVGLTIAGYVWLVVCAARSRAMGRSPWWGLLTVIPVLGWGVAIWLEFADSGPAEDSS